MLVVGGTVNPKMLQNRHCKGPMSLETIISLMLLVEILENIKKLIVIHSERLAGGSAGRECVWRRRKGLFACPHHTTLMVIFTPVRD